MGSSVLGGRKADKLTDGGNCRSQFSAIAVARKPGPKEPSAELAHAVVELALVFRAQVSVIAYHASPIPRLWPSSSSEGRTPRKETGSVFGAAGCCCTSAAVRCELSRLRLWESLLPSFV
jgi:hypothetical protein